MILRDLGAGLAAELEVVRQERDRSPLAFIMEALRYLDFWSYMDESERQKEQGCWRPGHVSWRRCGTRFY